MTMTPTEAHELIQRSRSASTEVEATEVEQLVRFLEDQIVQIFCQKKVFGPDELPPRSFAEFCSNLHEVDSGRRLVEVITEELASRLPRYGTKFTKKRAIMAIEPVYVAVRDEWLNRNVLA
jgi:hypothetical protein